MASSRSRGQTPFAPTIRPEDSTHAPGQSLPFQRWFKFKEAFSPQLVNGVLAALPRKPRAVLDCFGGSGTTALSCQMAGIESVTIEVNPLLQDLIEAKLTTAGPNQFITAFQRVVRASKRIRVDLAKLASRLPETFIEPGVKGRFLFYADAALAIERIRKAIGEEQDRTDRRLLTVALASVLIECSNVRVDGKGRRYRQGWHSRKVSSEHVYRAFYEKATQIGEDLASLTAVKRASFTLLRGDTREVLGRVSGQIDLALFSPPYPNSFDYTDIYNVELWMLGYLQSFQGNRELRLKTMRSHVQVQWEATEPKKSISKTLSATVRALEKVRDQLWDARIPEMVQGYFDDFRGILATLAPKLSDGAPVAMVVGNSQYGGIVIDTPTILAELGDALGMRLLHRAELRSMRTSHQQARREGLQESLLVLRT